MGKLNKKGAYRKRHRASLKLMGWIQTQGKLKSEEKGIG
jgi:hypothetical protein